MSALPYKCLRIFLLAIIAENFSQKIPMRCFGLNYQRPQDFTLLEFILCCGKMKKRNFKLKKRTNQVKFGQGLKNLTKWLRRNSVKLNKGENWTKPGCEKVGHLNNYGQVLTMLYVTSLHLPIKFTMALFYPKILVQTRSTIKFRTLTYPASLERNLFSASCAVVSNALVIKSSSPAESDPPIRAFYNCKTVVYGI